MCTTCKVDVAGFVENSGSDAAVAVAVVVVVVGRGAVDEQPTHTNNSERTGRDIALVVGLVAVAVNGVPSDCVWAYGEDSSADRGGDDSA
jgi:hypothetical protein